MKTNTIVKNAQDTPDANQLKIYQRLLADEKDGAVTAIRSFCSMQFGEYTTIGTLTGALEHWIKEEYKDECRRCDDEEMAANANIQLMQMIGTIRLLSVLENRLQSIENYEQHIRTELDKREA